MSCVLALRSPSHGTGWEETWTFTGPDERLLRDCLGQLDEFATAPPVEQWDDRKRTRVVIADDRWRAALLVYQASDPGWTMTVSIQADQAWTADAARRLAELLPDRFADLRQSIRRRFDEPDEYTR